LKDSLFHHWIEFDVPGDPAGAFELRLMTPAGAEKAVRFPLLKFTMPAR
jgi:hypothetical protein